MSFAHGSNDGQKGMGLIMLILIGTVPTAYALNRAVPQTDVGALHRHGRRATEHALRDVRRRPRAGRPARDALELRAHRTRGTPSVCRRWRAVTGSIADQVQRTARFAQMPADDGHQRPQRHVPRLARRSASSPRTRTARFRCRRRQAIFKAFKKQIDGATKFIPPWVKVAVAIALGLGTMVGWKRIVVTVGEKIGKTHLTYAQGASAELVAMATIAAADMFGLPVSTTHVLSSGVAGTMAANRRACRWRRCATSRWPGC